LAAPGQSAAAAPATAQPAVTYLAAQPKGILYCPRRLHTCLATLWTFWAVCKTQRRLACAAAPTLPWKRSRERGALQGEETLRTPARTGPQAHSATVAEAVGRHPCHFTPCTLLTFAKQQQTRHGHSPTKTPLDSALNHQDISILFSKEY